MKTKPNMPLATEGNYTEPQLGEQISGNELSPVNEQHTGDENKPKREMPEEQLVALEKYGLPRKDAKRLWIGGDRLLRNWQSMKLMLEASRPYLLQWEYEQQKAKQQGTEPRNPRGAGRKQIDMEIMFVTLMIQRFMSWSDVAIANAFAGSKLVCAVAWSLVDKGQLRFPARSTVQKYKAIFGNDGLSKQLLEVTTKTGLGLVANVLEANPAKDDDEHIEVGKVGYIDASFIDRPKFHYCAAIQDWRLLAVLAWEKENSQHAEQSADHARKAGGEACCLEVEGRKCRTSAIELTSVGMTRKQGMSSMRRGCLLSATELVLSGGRLMGCEGLFL